MNQCEAKMTQNKEELQGTLDKTLVGIQSELAIKEVPILSEIVAIEVELKLTSVSDNMACVQSALQQQTKSFLEDKY